MSSLVSGPSASKTEFRFTRPTISPIEQILPRYLSSFVDGMLTNGNVVARLEATIAERLGVLHCVAVSSCTSGLMLVLKALGVKGEVILPSFTFFVTGHAVLWNRLEPVFADCEETTFTIDPVDVEARITERTVAILAVHLYGNPPRIEALQRIAARQGLKLIFDAAHAFGSRYRGSPVGRFGDAEVFSLSPTKLLVAGEGGLVCTNDSTLARLVRAARNYGDAGSYDPELLGLNARMTEFNAAMALAGLDLVDHKIKRHNEIAERYTNLLTGAPGIGFQQVEKDNYSVYKDFSVLVSQAEFGMSRDAVGEALLSEGIPTKRYFYPPLHFQRLFTANIAGSRVKLPNTERISQEVLSLPIYESLPDEVVERTALAIRWLAGVSRAKIGAAR
ncbi:MAG TPA: DegT/DnrJ/EryC1/StrS family aminotransferase [Terriglobia bacterium]|nr:DegT/DnrJ/EryC1/StrS family aminotransferase [Terriglobia bacterium]